MKKVQTRLKICLGCFLMGAMGMMLETGHAALYEVNGATGAGGESILSNGNLKDNGDNRTITWITRGSVPKPGLFYTGAYGGSGRSVKLYCDDRANDNFGASQKSEYPFVTQTDSYAFPVAKDAGSAHYYTGFAVRLGNHEASFFDSIADRLLFYQIWQGGTHVSPGYNPPLAFQLLPYKGPISTKNQKLQIWVKNTTHIPNDDSSRVTFGTWNMKKNTWYQFVVTARPDWPNSGASKTGYLKVWMKENNGSESMLINKGSNYKWGYVPSVYSNNNTPGGKTTTVYRYLASTVTVYRAQQKRNHMINFDNIKHSTTKSSATP